MLLAMLITSMLATIGLGAYVLLLAPHRAVNRAFAAFTSAMALWTAKDILFWALVLDWFTADAWVASSLLLGLALQIAFVFFARIYPDERPVSRRLLAWAVGPCVVTVPLVLAGAPWNSAANDAGGFTITVTPAMWLYGAHAFSLSAAGIWMLVRKWRAARGTLEGKQLGIVIAVAGMIKASTLLLNVVLPLAGETRFIPYSSLVILAGALCYAYSVSNFRLFSISSVLDPLRLFPLTSKIALIIAGAGLLGFLALGIPVVRLSFGPRAPEEWERFVALSVMAGLVPTLVMIALIVRAVSRPVRRLTEAAVEVTRGRYGTEVTDLRSNDEVGVLAEAFNAMSRRVAQDIEQLREINDGLVRTEKLATAGVLAAGVAHEVNNPLASISSLAQILLKRARDADERETLETILGEISRISQILRDLTEFARPAEPKRASADLNRIVEACLRLVAVDRRFKRLRVETALDPDLPPLSADPDQIQQVILNLLLNARDATPEGGRVAVASRADGALGAVQIEVSDTGSGIPLELQLRVFDPFFTTKPPGKGTGLGLSVCYGIVRAHGGTIDVESTPGAGTTVRVRLPLEQVLGAERVLGAGSWVLGTEAGATVPPSQNPVEGPHSPAPRTQHPAPASTPGAS
jgi:signal transduction histidine kinase